MVNKKEMPQAGGTAQRGKDNLSHSNYSINTAADTITIPLAFYLSLVDTHQPEKYLRIAEKLDVIRRICQTKIQDEGEAAYIRTDLVMAVLGDEGV